jgi:hypothetical protein
MTNYRKVVAVLIAAWFIAVLTASALHVFNTAPGLPPLPLGLAALGPVAVYLLWVRSSERFRQFTLSLNPRTLTMVQSWRIIGFAFVALYAYGILPALFALPAGWGDVAIGATAPLAAIMLADPKHRSSFIFWQALGILDLVLALVLGPAASFIDPRGIPTSAVTVMPLSLIPTFVVPILLILHLICIAHARRWPGVSANRDSTSALAGADV